MPALSDRPARFCPVWSLSEQPSAADRQQQLRMQAALSTKAFVAAPAKVWRALDSDNLREQEGPIRLRCCCSAAANCAAAKSSPPALCPGLRAGCPPQPHLCARAGPRERGQLQQG